MISQSAKQIASSENRASDSTRNGTFRQENIRLKDLVVKLSAIIAKNVAKQK